ncbi:MAG: beta-N-acetylhexosaminidase, partial [Candidatus Hodarchaeota archaeon]
MLNKAQVSLIPEPVKMTYDSKHFILEDDTIIVADLELERISEYLKKLIAPPTGFNTQVEIGIPSERQKQTIILQINKELNLGKEGYYLIVSHDNIHISAPKPVGIFYGVQSLRQLLPIEIEKRSLVNDLEWVVLGVKIEDYHQFSWRGFMLDEGRHFQGKDTIRRLLDILAFHKMNVFHWYLTEDQGWRIEIKEYPHLAEIGSIREGTQIGGMRSFLKKKKKVDDTPQYGYYTQDEIKEIISYANDRFIKVIPDELMEIFPSKIIHIGGDEVPKSRWKECPDCQERIITENLNNEEDLQTYFINRVASYLIDKGIIPICWNDILHDRL